MHVEALRRRLIFVSVCWCVLAAALPARAGDLPAGAHVQVARTFEAPAFEHAVTRSYHVSFSKVVAADVDRDGDIDVITASDGVVVFWVNDGQGDLSSSQAPTPSSSVDGGAPAPVWGGNERGGDVASVQEDPPSVRPTGVYAHAPPSPAARRRVGAEPALRLLEIFDFSAPRAPPA